MEVADILLGKCILITTLSIFMLLAVWINTYPFIDKDSQLHRLIPDPKWFLLLCGTWGFFFVGGLMLFTLHHIYPYL